MPGLGKPNHTSPHRARHVIMEVSAKVFGVKFQIDAMEAGADPEFSRSDVIYEVAVVLQTLAAHM